MFIGKREIDNKEIADLALELFTENHNTPISIYSISKKLGVAEKWFQKRNRKIEDYYAFPDVTEKIIRTFNLFDEPLSTLGAYWLGYIMADGCVAPQDYKKIDGPKRLILEVKIDDIEILYNFCNTLGLRKERIYLGHHGRSAAITIQQQNFHTFVTEYGIVQNKSSIENYIDSRIIQNDNLFLSFFHGYFDGDGTVHPYKHSPGISIVGDIKFEEQIKQKFSSILPYPSSIFINMQGEYKRPYTTQHNINVNRPLYQLKIGTGYNHRENMRFLYNAFYNQTEYRYLTRKKLVFEQVLGTL